MSRFGLSKRTEALFDRHGAVFSSVGFNDRSQLNRRAIRQVQSFHRFHRHNDTIFTVNVLDAHHHLLILRLKMHQLCSGIDKATRIAAVIR